MYGLAARILANITRLCESMKFECHAKVTLGGKVPFGTLIVFLMRVDASCQEILQLLSDAAL